MWRPSIEKTDGICNESVEALPASARSEDPSSMQPIAKAIASAGEQWKLSTKRTRGFLNLLSKWPQAEIERQITLFSLKQRTNFDPVQLAFAASTYQKTALSPNAQLVERARAIVFESQTPDGTWPLGAPFYFDRITVAANYARTLRLSMSWLSKSLFLNSVLWLTAFLTGFNSTCAYCP
jgi:hypothetical protein